MSAENTRRADRVMVQYRTPLSTPEHHGEAQVGDRTIAWTALGDGPTTVLLLMGLGGRSTDWGTAFPSALARGHRVLMVDNRGTGRSARINAPFSLQDLADDAVGVLDATGTKKAHVVGISMGGMIAQRVAARAPERLSKLVLMSTHVGGLRVFWPHPRVFRLVLPERNARAEDVVRRRVAGIAAEGFAERHPERIEAMVTSALSSPTPLRTYNYQVQAILKDDRHPLLKHIRAETLVVHGDADPLVPVENGKLLARRIPDACLSLLRGCGHLPMWEQPEELAHTVGRFLG